MDLENFTIDVADLLKNFDDEKPIHKKFSSGIGPFGESQLVKEISIRLNGLGYGYKTKTRRTPDLDVNGELAVEFKIVRPFGDNGNLAENWFVNLLHPYEGNVSLIGDILKLRDIDEFSQKAIFLIAYEHLKPKINLDILISSFEMIVKNVLNLKIGNVFEERRENLIHPEHQVVRCFLWEVL
ncbi:MAG: hypothetical protein PVJ21_03180 [Anaerolineales bacterium]|jgi:hypothetical protein